MSPVFLLIAALSACRILAEPTDLHPQEPKSPIEIQDHHKVVGMGSYACSYTVRIKTSCSSPRITRDAISLSFGDAYRNEVYAPRLDDPSSRAFERCSVDTFRISGPCGYGVCRLYLQRRGWDGWTPEWVRIYEASGRSVTFYYGAPLPAGNWYGYDHCYTAGQQQIM